MFASKCNQISRALLFSSISLIKVEIIYAKPAKRALIIDMSGNICAMNKCSNFCAMFAFVCTFCIKEDKKDKIICCSELQGIFCTMLN